MTISPVGSGAPLAIPAAAAAGQVPDPQVQQAQVNAQADLLQAVQGTQLPVNMILARLSDGQGIDLYL